MANIISLELLQDELGAVVQAGEYKSKEEAMEWTRRFPNPAMEGKDGEIEVRQLFELDDFGPSEAVERFRKMDIA